MADPSRTASGGDGLDGLKRVGLPASAHQRPSGARSWIQRLLVRGRRRELGLGSVALVSLAEVREQARANRKLARAGGDPLADKRRTQDMPTFAAAAMRVVEQKQGGWRHSTHATTWRRSLERYAFPRIGSRRLAVRGQKLGRRVVMQVAGIVTPDPILRWYRRLIAQTYDGSARRGRGRPMPRRDVAARVVRMAVENPQWGHTRIRGALSNLGHEIARTTVKRILHDHGIDPAPERSRRLPWKTFLQAPWEGLTACDLFTAEVLTLAGLQRYLVFFVIALQSRRVTIAGIHPQPYGTWMEQMARNLTDVPTENLIRTVRVTDRADVGPANDGNVSIAAVHSVNVDEWLASFGRSSGRRAACTVFRRRPSMAVVRPRDDGSCGAGRPRAASQ